MTFGHFPGLVVTRRSVRIHQMNRVNSCSDHGHDDSTINNVFDYYYYYCYYYYYYYCYYPIFPGFPDKSLSCNLIHLGQLQFQLFVPISQEFVQSRRVLHRHLANYSFSITS